MTEDMVKNKHEVETINLKIQIDLYDTSLKAMTTMILHNIMDAKLHVNLCNYKKLVMKIMSVS